MANLFIFSDGDVLLDSERPVDVKRVLVQREHEHDQDEEGVEHGKEEHRLVAKFLQFGQNFSLKLKQNCQQTKTDYRNKICKFQQKQITKNK